MTQGDSVDFPTRSRLDHGPSKDHFFKGGNFGAFDRVAEFVTSHHSTNNTNGSLKKNSNISAGKEEERAFKNDVTRVGVQSRM